MNNNAVGLATNNLTRTKLYNNANVANNTKCLSGEQSMKQKLDNQSAAIVDALGVLNESNDIASKTLDELQENTESIKRSRNMANNIVHKSDEAKKSLGRIERRRKYFGFFDIFNWV